MLHLGMCPLTLGERGWLGIVCLLALGGVAVTALRRGYRYESPVLTTLAALTLAQLVA